jgi:YegS/Rv2252/BmrU family lipid kinase
VADGMHCAIFNPGAGSAAENEALSQQVEARADVVFCRTEKAGDVADFAANAAREGRDVVLAAGGDGTISEAVRGLMRARDAGMQDMPALLLLPLGTGNDLARTLGLDIEDPAANLKLLDDGERRRLDVIRWRLDREDAPALSGYAVNVLAGGFSSKLQQSLTPEVKQRWGPLAYARAAVATATELVPHRLGLQIDDGDRREVSVLNAVVANGVHAGGGIRVAPAADPFDGLLDLVLTAPGDVLDLAALSKELMSSTGDVLTSDLTEHLRGRKIELTADPSLPFSVDGDPIGFGHLAAEAVPAAIEVLVPRREPA